MVGVQIREYGPRSQFPENDSLTSSGPYGRGFMKTPPSVNAFMKAARASSGEASCREASMHRLIAVWKAGPSILVHQPSRTRSASMVLTTLLNTPGS